MKVEELYSQNKDSQIGVTFQRQPYETQVDIFPEVSPLEETKTGGGTSQEAGEPVESTLTSVQMEEIVCRVVKHKGEEEFQPIPLKRIDSGPNSHHIQATEEAESKVEESQIERSRHDELLDEIDKTEADGAKGEVKRKEKKDGTLSRMKERLRNIRGEKGEKGEKDDEGKAIKSLSKIFKTVNPVGKASRESFSKVFQRIGDALQKKDDDKEEARKNKNRGRTLSLDKRDEDEGKETKGSK